MVVEVDRARILDHCQFSVCWYHRCLPLWSWWGRVRIVSISNSGRVCSTEFTYTGYRVRSVGQNGKISYDMVPLSRDLFILQDSC